MVLLRELVVSTLLPGLIWAINTRPKQKRVCTLPGCGVDGDKQCAGSTCAVSWVPFICMLSGAKLIRGITLRLQLTTTSLESDLSAVGLVSFDVPSLAKGFDLSLNHPLIINNAPFYRLGLIAWR